MKILRTLALAGCLPTLSCHSLWADDDLVGDGHLVEVRPEVAPFSGVDVGNSFQVDVVIGEPEVVLRLDENIVNAGIVQISTENGVLTVRQCDGCRDFAPSAGAALFVSSPSIDKVRASGMASLRAATNARQIVIESSEEARLNVTLGAAETAIASADGMSTLELEGDVSALTLRASEEATLRSQGTNVAVNIAATDSTYVAARVTDRIRVRAADESAVVLDGNPPKRDVLATDEATISFSKW